MSNKKQQILDIFSKNYQNVEYFSQLDIILTTKGEIMKLKELRKKSHKTQQEIATMLGIQQNSYQRYENNESLPNIDKLIKLADYYNVSIDYLVGRIYQDDLGYISPDQRIAIKKLLKLNEQNVYIATQYIMGLLAGQGDNELDR